MTKNFTSPSSQALLQLRCLDPNIAKKGRKPLIIDVYANVNIQVWFYSSNFIISLEKLLFIMLKILLIIILI